jgi:hypothetical protein
MTESLFEAIVLPSRAVTTREGSLHVEGETVTLPESEADALEIDGFVQIVGRVTATLPKRKPRTQT